MINIPIQPVYTSLPGRESALPQAAERGQTTLQSAVTISASAVQPAAKAESSSRAADDESREKEASKERHKASAAPSAGESYDRRVVYEREFKRTFIDVVERSDEDDRLMRIPSEKLVRFLDEAQHSASAETTPQRRLDAIV